MTQIHTPKNTLKGFTMIEMLTVIAIIGILSSVVFANLSGTRERARDTERITEIAQIELALESYYNSCREYPTTVPLTVTDNNGCPTGITFGSFIDPIPQDPQGGDYDYGTDGDTYIVGATLETDHEKLAEDIDTDDHGVSCDDASRFYCKGG